MEAADGGVTKALRNGCALIGRLGPCRTRRRARHCDLKPAPPAVAKVLTSVGNGYILGTWDEANIPNVGYVARVLEDYYPYTDQPTMAPDGTALTTDQTAAAVQATVWFFSDRYVLNTSMGIVHDTVAAMAANVISQGPVMTHSLPA
jgi:Thioester domain